MFSIIKIALLFLTFINAINCFNLTRRAPTVNCKQDAIAWCKNYLVTKPNSADQNPAFTLDFCETVKSIDDPWQCEWGYHKTTPDLCQKDNQVKVLNIKKCRYGYTFLGNVPITVDGIPMVGSKCVWQKFFTPEGCYFNFHAPSSINSP
jgi:hypothetical protein